MINIKNLTLLLTLSCCLMACESRTSFQENVNIKQDNLFLDENFKGFEQVTLESSEEIFELSDEMKQLAKKISSVRETRKKAKKLLHYFFSPEKINLAYQSDANVIAKEAFRNKQANCLSLTIMAYAIAKEADLNVVFQRVSIPEYWVRNGNANMLTGHINLSVLEPQSLNKTIFIIKPVLEIDFDPFLYKRTFPKEKIDKSNVLAMFYNNKGANAMVEGDYLTAYAYFKKSTSVDPFFSPAWGNLGILYRINGAEQIATLVYRHALDLNPNNLTAMENLSLLLHKNGHHDEARSLDRHIKHKRENNPYYYALLADEKFYTGDYLAAVRQFRKAIKLNSNIHELYFGLAKAYYMLDEFDKAESNLRKAMRKSRSSRLEQEYLAKLNVLKQIDQDSVIH